MSRAKDGERPLIDQAVAGNSPVYSHGCKPPLPVAEGVAGKPSCRALGRKSYFRYSSQGCRWMTLYGYARVSVRELEDKNLDLQVEIEQADQNCIDSNVAACHGIGGVCRSLWVGRQADGVAAHRDPRVTDHRGTHD